MKNQKEIILKIIDALPQLQCKKCTYDDCKSYANAIVNNDEEINKCEPGSSHTEKQISNILNKNIKVIESNEIKDFPIAKITVEECIGCTICIKVCPVDAIIGAQHKQHFIIDDQCNGCELCITECPVDCMEMIPNKEKSAWKWPGAQANISKKLYNKKLIRAHRIKEERKKSHLKNAQDNKIQLYIKEALSRENLRRQKIKEYE